MWVLGEVLTVCGEHKIDFKCDERNSSADGRRDVETNGTLNSQHETSRVRHPSLRPAAVEPSPLPHQSNPKTFISLSQFLSFLTGEEEQRRREAKVTGNNVEKSIAISHTWVA